MPTSQLPPPKSVAIWAFALLRSALARKYDIFGQVTDGVPAMASLQKGSTIVWIAIEVTAPEP